jgi:hypothetical protein
MLVGPRIRSCRPTVLRDVVHEQRADGAAVVGAGDCAVPLLSRCVPDLRLDGLAIHLRPVAENQSQDAVIQATAVNNEGLLPEQ